MAGCRFIYMLYRLYASMTTINIHKIQLFLLSCQTDLPLPRLRASAVWTVHHDRCWQCPRFFSKDGRWCMNVRPYPIEDRQFSYENAGSANISAMGAGAAGCLSFFSRCWLLQVGHGRQPLWITTRWSGAGSPAPRLGVEKPVTKQAV